MKTENTKIISLTNPITRGENQITEITVNKPTVPALKGLKMFDVLQMDVDALQVLLARVTTPVLPNLILSQWKWLILPSLLRWLSVF